MPPKRMTANPLKPTRHRAGKSTGASSSSDSESSDAGDDIEPTAVPPPRATSATKIAKNLNQIDLSAQRKEAAAAEARRLAAANAERLAVEEGFVTEEETEQDESAGDEDSVEDSESSDGESSDEEIPRRLMLRPKFIPKSQRNQAVDEDDGESARRASEAARKQATDDLVEEQIKKDLAARAVGKRHWDDAEDEDSDVDTTDGLDPMAEEAAWRVREMKRLKRAREAIEEREKALAEIERRRNLTEEERNAEDEAYLAQQREEKDNKGHMSYMQKYYHKGAFFQEEAEAAGLLQRDIMGSRIADDVRNRETLPAYLQKRDMTQLGRKGGTKYKDMRSEDTGQWGSLDTRRSDKDGGGRFEDSRFRPDDERFKANDGYVKGSNATPLGDRKERVDGRRSGEQQEHRSNDHHQRQISRSRSPPRLRDDKSNRKRSTSREGNLHDGDKRRRLDLNP